MTGGVAVYDRAEVARERYCEIAARRMAQEVLDFGSVA